MSVPESSAETGTAEQQEEQQQENSITTDAVDESAGTGTQPGDPADSEPDPEPAPEEAAGEAEPESSPPQAEDDGGSASLEESDTSNDDPGTISFADDSGDEGDGQSSDVITFEPPEDGAGDQTGGSDDAGIISISDGSSEDVLIFEDASGSSDDEQDETSDDSESDSDDESEEPIAGVEVIIYDGEDAEAGSNDDPEPEGTTESTGEPPAENGDTGSVTPPPFIVEIGFANPPDGGEPVPAPDEIERPVVDEQPEPGRFGGIPGLTPRPGLAASPLSRDLPVTESPEPNPREALAEARPEVAFPGQIESKEAAAPQADPPPDDSLDVFDTQPGSDGPPRPDLEPDKEAGSLSDPAPSDTREATDDGLPPLSFSTPTPREFGQDNSEPAEPAAPDIVTSDPGREFGRGPRQAFDYDDGSDASLGQDTFERRPSDFENDDEDELDDDDLGF